MRRAGYATLMAFAGWLSLTSLRLCSVDLWCALQDRHAALRWCVHAVAWLLGFVAFSYVTYRSAQIVHARN